MADNSDGDWGEAIEDGVLSEENPECDDEEEQEPRFRRMTREEAMAIDDLGSVDEE